ncbi:MAG UNVERIFIED_CONTAM: DUF2256 domain-containing protein [Planctomycetaceae bacterium]|jgi:hypothetical protein
MRKSELPEKICCGCGRPFSWRKRWERNWNEVRFCSERCRRNRGRATEPAAVPTARVTTRHK